MKKIFVALVVAVTLVLTGCGAPDAQVASENLSVAADQFEIERRVVFFNGITDSYLLTIEGRCAIVDEGNQLEVTCKIADGEYKKHFLGLSDNVSYLVEQIEVVDVDVYHYRIIFKPEALIPSIDLETSLEDR